MSLFKKKLSIYIIITFIKSSSCNKYFDHLTLKIKKALQKINYKASAEKEGFEPPVPCGTLVFKTSAFDHSAISPVVQI